MTHAAAFLAAIIADPHDDAVRLILADWLEDHGQPERGDFIRVQCELARIDAVLSRMVVGHDHRYQPATTPPLPSPHCPACRLAKTAKQLRRREEELFRSICPMLPEALDAYLTLVPGPPHGAYPLGLVRRGFVASITCTLADWERYGTAIVRSQPIEKVTLSDKQPGTNTERPSEYCWSRAHTEQGQRHEDCYWWLPAALYDLLHGVERISTSYLTRPDALLALSDACLRLANKEIRHEQEEQTSGEAVQRPRSLHRCQASSRRGSR